MKRGKAGTRARLPLSINIDWDCPQRKEANQDKRELQLPKCSRRMSWSMISKAPPEKLSQARREMEVLVLIFHMILSTSSGVTESYHCQITGQELAPCANVGPAILPTSNWELIWVILFSKIFFWLKGGMWIQSGIIKNLTKTKERFLKTKRYLAVGQKLFQQAENSLVAGEKGRWLI